jgi:hypothetical protein
MLGKVKLITFLSILSSLNAKDTNPLLLPTILFIPKLTGGSRDPYMKYPYPFMKKDVMGG